MSQQSSPVERRGDSPAAGDRPLRIFVLCPYPIGVAAAQRLKFEQYYDDWRRHGYEVTAAPFMDRKTWDVLYSPGHYGTKAFGVLKGYLRRFADLFRIRRYDLVFVHMWVTPFGPPLFEMITRALARRVIFDVEDNVVTHGFSAAGNPNPILRFLKGPGKPRYLIQAADHVITSSPFLNDTCIELNRKRACTYISSSVDTDRFLPATSYTNADPVTIGWTGTFSSKPMLDLLRGVFQQLAARMPYKLKVIGNFDYELPGVDLEVVRWTAEREVEDLQTLDIGVYPLALDDWVLGKSGLKAIQYMAFALPTVATKVGTTPMLIRSGENGILVETEEEWLEALEGLLKDPELRRRLGQAARNDAVNNYSTRAIAGQYRRVLENAMGN